MRKNPNRKNYKKPKSIRGGIKTRTSRNNTYSNNWWSLHWIKILESNIDSVRLSRGKTYARKGQVANITIDTGLVTAFVQGTREKPYQIKLGFQTVTDAQMGFLLLRFKEKASFAAKLLTMEMPKETEEAFAEVGMELFPNKGELSRFKCTCSDFITPCKHIAAVLLLMAEGIGENPLLLLKLRGLDRQRLLNQLTSEMRIYDDTIFEEYNDAFEKNAPFIYISGGTDSLEKNSKILKEELPLDKDWYSRGQSPVLSSEENNYNYAMALERMNNFPFWRGEKSFLKTLVPYYDKAMDKAFKIMLGEKISRQARKT